MDPNDGLGRWRWDDLLGPLSMSKMLYVLVTFFESILGVFGIRATLEQPPYRVVSTLADTIEIRAYGPLVVVETQVEGDEGDAFSRLFRYIAGANAAGATIKMTAPVTQTGGARFGGPAGSEGQTMQFVVPAGLAADPPAPSDPRVHLATVPARRLAVIRFAGSFGRRNLDAHLRELREALRRQGQKSDGVPIFLGYDPPFTIPFLRRNEVALQIEP